METIRCNNCGWDNPVNLSNCEKCKVPLKKANFPTGHKEQNVNNVSPMAGTRVGMQPDKPFLDEPEINDIADSNHEKENLVCPSCGYSIRQGVKTCPKCHGKIEIIKSKTINPYDKVKEEVCFLKPKSRKGETEINKLKFSGNLINLNRENLEPNNMTITSKTQAVLSFKDGKWYGEDKSEMKTTFTQIKEPIELKKGDIILMGDRLFEFDYE